MTPLGIDPGALLRLEVTRTIPDDGHEHLVEAVLQHRADGRLEVEVWDDEGQAVASLTLRSDFLHRIITTAIANDRRARATAAA